MKKISNKPLLLYSVIMIIVFFLFPLLFKGGIAFLFLINPLAIFLSSIICSYNNNKLVLSIVFITALLFLPTIFIFYNESAWIYVVFYAVVSFVGCFIGLIRSKKK